MKKSLTLVLICAGLCATATSLHAVSYSDVMKQGHEKGKAKLYNLKKSGYAYGKDAKKEAAQKKLALKKKALEKKEAYGEKLKGLSDQEQREQFKQQAIDRFNKGKGRLKTKLSGQYR